MFIAPIRINGQTYSYRDLRCAGDPRLSRIAGGMTAFSFNNAAQGSPFHGVAQQSLAMIPGMQQCNVSMSLRVEEWHYLMTAGVLPPQGYSDKRFDWELLYGLSEGGGIASLRMSNFHFLGVVGGSYRMGDALVHDIGCYVDSVEENPGNGIYFSPVTPAFLVQVP